MYLLVHISRDCKPRKKVIGVDVQHTAMFEFARRMGDTKDRSIKNSQQYKLLCNSLMYEMM